MLTGLSPLHWIVILSAVSITALPIIPLWRILHRMGLPPALSFIWILPCGGLILLFVMGWSPWPRAESRPNLG